MKPGSSHFVAPAIASSLRVFWFWWLGELVALVPSFLKAETDRSGDVLLLSFDESSVAARTRTDKSWHDLGGMDLRDGDPDLERREFRFLIQRLRLHNLSVGLRLSSKLGLRKRLEFPLAAEKELRRILSHQMDLLVPYRADQVYFDYHLVGRDLKARKIAIELLTVPKAVVEKSVSRARDWGLEVDFVDLGGAGDTTLCPIRLAPTERAGRRPKTRKGLIAGLAFANAAMIALTLGLPLLEKSGQKARLEEQVASAQLKAEVVAKLREKVERLKAETAFLTNKKQESPLVIAIMDEVTTILPDDSWLNRLSLKQGILQLNGSSPKSSALIRQLEASALLENVRFRAPVTQDRATGAERFFISADATLETGS